MSLVNPSRNAPPPNVEPPLDAPVKVSAPAKKGKPSILSTLRYACLALGVIYGLGVVTSHFINSAEDRTACHEAAGFSGLLWCPDWVQIEGYHVHFVNALGWPLNFLPARAVKTKRIENVATATRRANDVEFTKEREATLRASTSEAQRLLNILGYNIGVADGVIGQRTHDAISKFQLQGGMQMSGLVSDELIARLKNSVQARQTKTAEPR